MILKQVQIKNFRQYKDVVIDFAQDSNKNFTIIQGNNGTGKTTLLNALSWCLYGEEIHDYGDDSSMDLCNNKTEFLANEGDNFEIMVKIDFKDGDNLLSFKRTLNMHKNNNKSIKDSFGSPLQVITQEGNDIDLMKGSGEYIVERKIPKEIEDYFFFDGARLGEYFQQNSNEKIKKSVFKLSQLNLIDNVNNNLNKVIDKYNKKLKKLNPQLGQANDKISYYTKEKNDRICSLNESKKVIEDCKKEITSILNELKNYPDLKQSIKRREDLKNEIDKLHNKIKSLELSRKDIITRNYPYLLAYDYLYNFLDKQEEFREKKYIPADFKRSFVEDLLKEGKCICGADLNSNEDSRRHLENLLNNTKLVSDKSEDVTTAFAVIKRVCDDLSNFKEEILTIKRQIQDINTNLREKNEEIKRISAKLDKHPQEKVNKLEERQSDLEDELSKHDRFIGAYELDIENFNKEIARFKQLRSKEKGLEIQAREFDEKIKFCEQAIEASTQINNELTSQMREKIQELTKKKFIKVQWKEDEFNDMRIDNDYGVYITNKLGQEERPGDLSDGEKLCLGLCFMSALHNISGFDLPIIMDTPLGNLDKDMRHNIAKFLPDFVEGKQIVLIVTGTEYTDDFRDTIYDHVGKEYVIEWENSDEGKESKVVLKNEF